MKPWKSATPPANGPNPRECLVSRALYQFEQSLASGIVEEATANLGQRRHERINLQTNKKRPDPPLARRRNFAIGTDETTVSRSGDFSKKKQMKEKERLFVLEKLLAYNLKTALSVLFSRHKRQSQVEVQIVMTELAASSILLGLHICQQ